MAFEPGAVLGGKYVLRERIGEGGMGAVFLADQPALGRTVAIKILHPEHANNRALARRFREEAVAASRVRHPRSVTVIDCAVLPDGTPYIVMEHVHGRSLGRVIAEEDVPLPRVIDLALQILSALDAAHASGVVHADVKCENFLVEHVDGADHVTMIDFGLARVAGERERFDDELGERVVSGTPEYMAPEVIRGEPPVPGSDLYAVGVILYELLTGSTPFGGGAATEIMARHLDDLVIPPSVRAGDRDIPRALDAIVLTALEKEPGMRFQSADELSRALRSALPAGKLPPARGGRPHDSATPDSPTRTHAMPQSQQRFARGSGCNGVRRDERADQLRRAIGSALRDGNVTRIADGYVALSAALASEQRLAAAACELEEGIAVLSTCASPECVDRLTVALGALYTEADQQP
jgi:serine/threonine protein kinase